MFLKGMIFINIFINKLINIIIISFFSMSLILPKLYSEMKLVILLILILISLINIMSRSIKIKKDILLWYLSFILYHLVWITISIYNNNNIVALINTFRLFVIYPLIFLILSLSLSNSKSNKFHIIFNTIFVSNFIISIYTILLFIDSINLIDINFLYQFSFTISRGVHQGYTKIGGENITTLFFTFPFVLTYYNHSENKNDKFLILNIIISIFAILISGRRMLQLVIIISLFLNLITRFLFINKTNKNKFISLKSVVNFVIIIFLFFISVYFINNFYSFDIFLQRMIKAFSLSEDNVRYLQIIELLKHFTDNPFIGVGFGKGIDTVVRSTSRPWAYEVTYVLQLYQTGIIGFIIYILLLTYNIYLGIKVILRNKDKYMFSLLNGYICFLIACISNPLLASFDFMWTIYIIPLYVNYLYLTKKKI